MAVRIMFVKGWTNKLDDAIHDFMVEIAKDVYEDMMDYCPVDTGELKADLDWEVIDDVARIGAESVPYAIYAEEGAAPHMIYPNEKEALWWEGAGHPRASVSHPGYEGHHFMKRALYQYRSSL